MRGESAAPDQDGAPDANGSASSKLLLIDSDAFVLLAAAGLLDKAIGSLGFNRDDARRLDALPGMLRRGKKFGDLTTVERDAVLAWCDRIAPFRESPGPKTMQQMAGIANIDGGEATLLATCHDNPNAVLLTGDKRALRALAKDAPDFCAKLSGRVACLEQVLVTLVRSDGVATISAALAVRAQHHQTIAVCFSMLKRTDQDECLRSLHIYINDLEKDLPANWLI